MSAEMNEEVISAQEQALAPETEQAAPEEPVGLEARSFFMGMSVFDILGVTGPNGLPIVTDRPGGLDATLRYAQHED